MYKLQCIRKYNRTTAPMREGLSEMPKSFLVSMKSQAPFRSIYGKTNLKV